MYTIELNFIRSGCKCRDNYLTRVYSELGGTWNPEREKGNNLTMFSYKKDSLTTTLVMDNETH
jgi:hypothetical protein